MIKIEIKNFLLKQFQKKILFMRRRMKRKRFFDKIDGWQVLPHMSQHLHLNDNHAIQCYFEKYSSLQRRFFV